MLVVPVQRFRFIAFQPVVVAALQQGVDLRVDARIVHREIVRTVDALHLEGQPAAVSGGVGQEVGVVAGAAKTGNVPAVLLVVGVGGALIHGLHGGERLYLVHLLRLHLVQLFQADDGKLGEGEQVVLGDAARVALQVEVAAQLGRQQVVQPGGLVDALAAGEHQYLVVHHVLVEQRGRHAHQPLLEVVGEGDGVVAHVHVRGEQGYVVGDAVPGREVAEIRFEGVEQGNELGVEHGAYVRRRRLHFLAHAAPKGVDVAVRQFLVLPVGAVGRQCLALARDGVLTESPLRAQKLFYFRHRCQELRSPPVACGVFLSRRQVRVPCSAVLR